MAMPLVERWQSPLGQPPVARSLALMILGATLWAGCGRQEQRARDTAATDRGARAISTSAVAAVDSLEPLAPLTPPAPGDAEWEKIFADFQPPTPPSEWETNPPSPQAVAAFEGRQGDVALTLANQLKDFYTRFPTNANAREARDREYDLLNLAVKAGRTNGLARLEAIETARLQDPSTPEQERLQVRLEQLQRVLARYGDDRKAILTEMEKGTRALLKEFPKRTDLAEMLLTAARGWLDFDLEKSRALAQEIARQPDEAELQAEAQMLLRKMDRLGQPLALAFTAMDGRPVDLNRLKGKVVLIDFWATWCMPCIVGLPEMKRVYEKYHPRGLEIVGISLDNNKAALETLVAREQIPWPQYFEEQAEQHRFAEAFEVSTVPTIWLVDKKGNLRHLSAGPSLEKTVADLLAEP